MMKRIQLQFRRGRGFTLVELVVATGLFSLFLVVALATAQPLAASQNRANVVSEVQTSGRLVADAVNRLAETSAQTPSLPTVSGTCAIIPSEWTENTLANATTGDQIEVTNGTSSYNVYQDTTQSGNPLILDNATSQANLTDAATVTTSSPCFEVMSNSLGVSYVRYSLCVDTNNTKQSAQINSQSSNTCPGQKGFRLTGMAAVRPSGWSR